ncbi:hypothetical protein ARMSODRAFT_120761 [Armillaria solidipes]|uniref:Uncharacterized protein n=1 Tax=Armillaria solidipes TaxID=1076256 RepID=A0A2H3B1I6_9AGAR|nr:hypothetical protein ARMSODRAFT_120761 [Armillaria solidipes]
MYSTPPCRDTSVKIIYNLPAFWYMGVAAVRHLRSDPTQSHFPCCIYHHQRLFPTIFSTENTVTISIPSLSTACHEGQQMYYIAFVLVGSIRRYYFCAPTLRAHYVVLDLLSLSLSGSDKHCLLLACWQFAELSLCFVSTIHYLSPEDAVGNPERPRI